MRTHVGTVLFNIKFSCMDTDNWSACAFLSFDEFAWQPVSSIISSTALLQYGTNKQTSKQTNKIFRFQAEMDYDDL